MLVSAVARDVTFFHVSDTQPDNDGTSKLIHGAIEEINRLPGEPYPAAFGGSVDEPRGIIITGDLTDDSSQQQWDIFLKDWGLTGKEGLVRFPLYEGAGNHDGAVSTAIPGLVRRGIIERNKKRVGVKNLSGNGFHYSYDWDDVHFVCLNEYGGLEKDQRYEGNVAYGRKRQSYGNPAEESLQFLRDDLASQVADSGRPVILYQHYGFDDFVFHPWGNDAAWWTEAQAMRLWDAIEGYNVIAILCGHNGSEATFDWLGIVNQHMDDHVKFGVYRITDDKMIMAIRDSKTQQWGQSWTRPTQVNSSLPPDLVQGPYLVPTKVASEMTVCWRMKSNSECSIQWGTDYFKFEGGSTVVKPYNTDLHLYQYTIKGLAPGASVQYTLKIGDRYAPGMFYTPAAEAKKVKFLVATAPAESVARDRMFKAMVDKIYLDPAYHSFIVDTGSVVPEKQGIGAWDEQLFNRAKSSRHIRQMLARSPLVSTTGLNRGARILFPHDYQKGGAYAYHHEPAHVMVIAAQADLGEASAQARWLVHELEESTSPMKMIVWSPSGDRNRDQTFTDQLATISKKHGVNLILREGDRFAHEERNGTTTITTSATATSIGTLLAVTVENGTVSCQQLDANGGIQEEFKWKLNP
jgi:hypothetical protein